MVVLPKKTPPIFHYLEGLSVPQQTELSNFLRDLWHRVDDLIDKTTQRLDRMDSDMSSQIEGARAEVRKGQEDLRRSQDDIRERVMKAEITSKTTEVEVAALRRELVEHTEWADRQAGKIEVLETTRTAEGQKLLFAVQETQTRLDWWSWLLEKWYIAASALAGFGLSQLLDWWKDK